MVLLLKILSGIILALPSIYFNVKKKKGKIIRYLLPLMSSVLIVLSSYAIDYYNLISSDPEVRVTVNKQKDGEMVLLISKRGKFVDTLDIDFPILGKVKNIHDLSSSVDRETVTKRVIGEQTVASQNNVQLSIKNISATTKELEFKILFMPMLNRYKTREVLEKVLPPSVLNVQGNTVEEMLWLDRFCFRYTWSHYGNTIEKKKWISIDSNNEISPPPVSIQGTFFVPYEMGLKEMRQYYEKGIAIHEFK